MLNSDQQRIIQHLEQIEEVGELILAKQEQSVQCDKNRQQTREALHHLTKEPDSTKHWVMLCDQFFRLPDDILKAALKEDMKSYDAEIERIRNELKEEIRLLGELEGRQNLRGFDLTALSNSDPYCSNF